MSPAFFSMIDRLSFSDISALKTMWKLCFPEDTTQFINFYFEKVFNANQSLALWENKTLTAFMQILPQRIKIGDKTYDAGYISGAMTHPDHRKKGYMQQLLLFAFEEMKKKNYTFSFLIPQEEWLFNFYARYGYEKAFPKSTQLIHLEENNIDYSCVETYQDFKNLPVNEIYRLYSSLLNQKENAVLKNREQFELVLEDLFIDNGRCFYIKNKSFAFVAAKGNCVLVKELFNAGNDSGQLLFAAIKDAYQTNNIILQDHNQTDEYSQYYGMIKVLDTLKFTQSVPENVYMNMMMD